ncbi:hypothetical protein V496_01639 [Pseudogymnoascus sp. VKM F-4515 (FW-2607)]|nr:hypothetical protein V496_01639 [Pseudogymnoascus sp. VKM F-4515 (FW-2607)]
MIVVMAVYTTLLRFLITTAPLCATLPMHWIPVDLVNLSLKLRVGMNGKGQPRGLYSPIAKRILIGDRSDVRS